jgi:hypothetical protein
MSTTHGNRCDDSSATDARTVPLSPDERELVQSIALSLISSRADDLIRAYDLEPPEVLERFSRLAAAIPMLHACDRGVLDTGDDKAVAQIVGERDYLIGDATEAVAALAKLAGGVDALADYYDDESCRSRMTISDLLEDVALTREQTERHRRQAAILTGLLDRIGGKS